MTLFLQVDHIQAIQHHAVQTYPEECCGLMLGIRESQHTNPEHREQRVFEIYPTLNVWDLDTVQPDTVEQVPEQSRFTAQRRYRIDPVAMIQAQQYARSNGWDIIGIYHSHPNHPAVPSEWDRAWAWPQYSYAIVSVEKDISRDLQSWVLDDTSHKFLPEKLVVVGTTPLK